MHRKVTKSNTRMYNTFFSFLPHWCFYDLIQISGHGCNSLWRSSQLWPLQLSQVIHHNITLSAQLFFKTFSSRGSSYKVVSGGWVLYSEPNYQGKATYQFGGETYENAQSGEVVIDSSLHIISKSEPITVHFVIERFQNNWAPRKQRRCYLLKTKNWSKLSDECLSNDPPNAKEEGYKQVNKCPSQVFWKVKFK